MRRVDELLKAGYVHVVDADLKGYFDSIPHDRLLERLKEKIADGRVLSLIESFLKASILEAAGSWTPEAGAPQGAVLSPLLSNVYLDPLDHLLAKSGFEMVRYADDFVILCRTAEEAVKALELVTQWTAANGLILHPTKTRIVDSRVDSFAFLGYEFRGEHHWPRKKSLQKLKDNVREKTRRTSGESLKCVIAKLNPTLRGWFVYFQHSTYANVFRDIDGFVRRRLRSILRRRIHLRGDGRGRDHQRCGRWRSTSSPTANNVFDPCRGRRSYSRPFREVVSDQILIGECPSTPSPTSPVLSPARRTCYRFGSSCFVTLRPVIVDAC